MTFSGVMVQSKPNDRWTLSAAWTKRTFNSLFNKFGDNGYLGKMTYHFDKSASLTYKVFFHDKGGRHRSYDSAKDFLNTLIFTWQISDHWFYMVEGAITDGKPIRADAGATYYIGNRFTNPDTANSENKFAWTKR